MSTVQILSLPEEVFAELGISFPLISSGIFGGSLANPVAESTKQCCRAYLKFISDYPDYFVDVKLCAFSAKEMQEAKLVFSSMIAE